MLAFLFALSLPSYALEIEHQTYQLDNGLRVILVEDHDLPQVVVNVWYGVGSFDDPTGASGFAHLFEHLMFMGTNQVPEGQFDLLMESAGGQNNASTGSDRTNYYSWGTANTLELLLYLEADRMTGLQITQEKLDLQRDVVRNERRQNYEDPPYGLVWLELPEMLYPEDHPYHLEGIGSHEDLLNANLAHVSGFYTDWYAPNNATLTVAGDFDEAWVRSRIEALFGGLQPAVMAAHATYPEVTAPVIPHKRFEREVPAPALVMAWHTPPFYQPGDAELDVIGQLLTEGEGSRLTQRLIYEDELAQEVWAFQWSQQRSSVFLVWVTARPGVSLERVRSAVQEEIDALAGDRPPGEVELLRVKNSLEMDFIEGLQTLRQRAEQLQAYQFYVGDTHYLESDVQRYRSVGAEEVSEVVSAWLGADRAASLEIVEAVEEEVTP